MKICLELQVNITLMKELPEDERFTFGSTHVTGRTERLYFRKSTEIDEGCRAETLRVCIFDGQAVFHRDYGLITGPDDTFALLYTCRYDDCYTDEDEMNAAIEKLRKEFSGESKWEEASVNLPSIFDKF